MFFSRPPAEPDTSKLDVFVADAKVDVSDAKGEYWRLVGELRPWVVLLKWIAGGTIAAFVAAAIGVDAYIERKISTHIRENDELTFALSAANNGDWHNALGAITNTWNRLERGGALTPESKQFLFSYIVWIISSDSRYDWSSKVFEGQPEWFRLLADADFRRFVHGPAWRSDPNMHRGLALCQMKFGTDDAAIAEAFDDLSLARYYDIDHSPEILSRKDRPFSPELTKQVASDDFTLALQRLVVNDRSGANTYLSEAALGDPSNYDLDDLCGKYGVSLLHSPDFTLWRLIALRWNVKDFDDRFASTLKTAHGLNKPCR
jgi:hypothetical protein